MPCRKMTGRKLCSGSNILTAQRPSSRIQTTHKSNARHVGKPTQTNKPRRTDRVNPLSSGLRRSVKQELQCKHLFSNTQRRRRLWCINLRLLRRRFRAAWVVVHRNHIPTAAANPAAVKTRGDNAANSFENSSARIRILQSFSGRFFIGLQFGT